MMDCNDGLALLNLKMECGKLMDAVAGVAADESLHHILVPEQEWNQFCEAVVNIENFDPLDKALDELRMSGQQLLDSIARLVGAP